jgi:hypothetical protein
VAEHLYYLDAYLPFIRTRLPLGVAMVASALLPAAVLLRRHWGGVRPGGHVAGRAARVFGRGAARAAAAKSGRR